jgi:hypothetical protein
VGRVGLQETPPRRIITSGGQPAAPPASRHPSTTDPSPLKACTQASRSPCRRTRPAWGGAGCKTPAGVIDNRSRREPFLPASWPEGFPAQESKSIDRLSPPFSLEWMFQTKFLKNVLRWPPRDPRYTRTLEKISHSKIFDPRSYSPASDCP